MGVGCFGRAGRGGTSATAKAIGFSFPPPASCVFAGPSGVDGASVQVAYTYTWEPSESAIAAWEEQRNAAVAKITE